ncbi:hypothetical protein Gohar_023841, partial [Gossypium harknessii]|nr:hypothetical protein [Gossypium harknessii]
AIASREHLSRAADRSGRSWKWREHLAPSVRGSLLTMAQADQISNSPEIKEPSPKVPKLGQNGVHEVTHGPASLLKVKKLSEKAVLPSRGSPLAAGYDLS